MSKPNETILSLQYCKLLQNADESTKECMQRLGIKVSE